MPDNNLLQLIIWPYVCLMVVLILVALYKKQDLDLLPSILWLVLITFSFAVQSSTFADDNLYIQLFGIMYIGAMLYIGDTYHINIPDVAHTSTTIFSRVFSDYRLYVVLFMVVAAFHISLLDHVPLWEKYINNITDEKLLQSMREKTSKLLAVPDILKYVFNWIVNIAAPVAIYLLVVRKKFLAALLIFVIAILYAKLSLAKVPSFILTMCVLVMLLWNVTYAKRVKGYLFAFIICVPLLIPAVWFFAFDPSSIFNERPDSGKLLTIDLPDNDPRSKLTIGDYSRLQSRDSAKEAHFLSGRYNYYMYRIFLVPVEVSNRWYQYFPKYNQGFVGWEGLIPGVDRSNYIHPAQKVGNWAYTERFPMWYIPSIRAYASVDAEAYGRFGIFGVVVVGMLLLILRIALKMLLSREPVIKALYITGLVMFSLLLPMASLQAILVANGLIVVVAAMLAWRWLSSRST